MKHITISKGLDLPLGGVAERTIDDKAVKNVGIIGDDYPGMKPTMLVNVGDRVIRGQALFTDKKNEGVTFTSPGCGEVTSIVRGAKRKFESLSIRLDGDEAEHFCEAGSSPASFDAQALRELLIKSGLWCALRTRPYGKIPAIDTSPRALFITAIDTNPLGADMALIIDGGREDFLAGLTALQTLIDCPVYLCVAADQTLFDQAPQGVEMVGFSGPHPAGLPSTHIHFLDPVGEGKTVWHIGAQDVIAVGTLLRTGTLPVNRIVALAGPGIATPRHIRTQVGASLVDLSDGERHEGEFRVISGSVLDGRKLSETHQFLGRYHQQVSVIHEDTGRQFFGWLMPGGDRFSVTRAFLSAFTKPATLPLNTAVWGGDRAIYPAFTYEKVMPLDIIPVYLLRSLMSGNTEKAKDLGCLELIEEDIALCSYVCPGKNEFGPKLREVLTSIELEG
ncbi:MAG: Na(+)-translocating NADH-quinone reductase subunit A [Desulfofustis sp. PB-SRB1]|jgi:Na+-transporting NADH:ubiquinone oxidoreductase subunit A|nr:Na(+)-translocating NADH-quinone reductase subunit A [Desulfofustis sp. PB-SRB1]MBM1003266.1 Na(+)-translocating NADH-quinone reductase subunit A [Desulfofustis sp. PB-SRB1]HBH28616.1 NADH:ubiquinone reductase (Na(+)-transporting) subunit A [Desulfofustis sp.]